VPHKKPEAEAGNSVTLEGKVTQSGRLKYTPAGIAVLEMCIAIPQAYLEKRSVGYFTVLLTGELAESTSGKFQVGSQIKVQGSLWTRKYKNRHGTMITEFHIVASETSQI
jgi:single-stranded DNA-binding protein